MELRESGIRRNSAMTASNFQTNALYSILEQRTGGLEFSNDSVEFSNESLYEDWLRMRTGSGCIPEKILSGDSDCAAGCTIEQG